MDQGEVMSGEVTTYEPHAWLRPDTVTGDRTLRYHADAPEGKRYSGRLTTNRLEGLYGEDNRGFPLGCFPQRSEGERRIFDGRPSEDGATVEELEHGIPVGTFGTIRKTWRARYDEYHGKLSTSARYQDRKAVVQRGDSFDEARDG